MTKHLQKCVNCGEYSLANPELKCIYCGGQLTNVKPPKFSLQDKFGKYRLKYFKEEFEKKYN
ncbi:MAG: ribosome biogenesis protein [Candidatus Lokiarchaeota archaeon]|nr:ribosome biogenesis protein [Candidatus Lokiarchaeota archaeon]